MSSHLTPAPRGPLEPGTAPSFSVIIAAYEAAATVADAVASALEQTVPPLEVIVCDDGSSDDPAGALERFGDRVRLLRIEHAGTGAARNAAAAAAGGEFVAILDADDLYRPRLIEALGELAAARPDLDILTTDALLVRDGVELGTFYERETFVVDDQRLGVIARDFILGGAAVRRSRLLDAGGFDASLPGGEDRDCWLRLILGGARAGLVAEPLYVYRLSGATRSADRVRNLRAALAILERAEATQPLSPRERAEARRCIAGLRRELLLGEADVALRERTPDRRRRALAVARDRGFGWRTRLKAVASAAAPALARRRLGDGDDRRRTRLGQRP